MKYMVIRKVFNDIDDLNSSEEFKNLWEGFHMEREVNYPNLVMLKAFIVDDGRIFGLREITKGQDQGLRLLGEITTHTMLTNSPFMMGVVSGDMILINDEKGYSRCMENRIVFAKHCQQYENAFVATRF